MTDMETFNRRLDHLERQIRRLRWGVGIVVLASAVLVGVTKQLEDSAAGPARRLSAQTPTAILCAERSGPARGLRTPPLPT